MDDRSQSSAGARPRRARQWVLRVRRHRLDRRDFAAIGLAIAAIGLTGGVVYGQLSPSPRDATLGISRGTSLLADSRAQAKRMKDALAAAAARPFSGTAPRETIAPLSATARVRMAPPGFAMVFPDSATRLLQPADLVGLGPGSLRIARGEILARHGKRFRDPWMRGYFSNYTWYRPERGRVLLNDIEARNVRLIKRAEMKYR